MMQSTTTFVSKTIRQGDLLAGRVAEASALAGVFGFFSRCLEEEVDLAFAERIRGELRQPLKAFGLIFDEEFYAVPAESLVETLDEEYTGLFVAPGSVSPYASVFETGCMFKEPADRALTAYRQAGWDYKRRLSGEFPDHIGTMLGFYAILAEAESESLTVADISRADGYKTQRNRFLDEQLGPWGPGWCRRAAEAALHPFYEKLLQILEQALWAELVQIVDRRRLRELVELNQRRPKHLDYDADFRKASGL
ncbi:MAG: molecular chaperone TorD family protein [Candidatus Thiodiazotropha sp. (ex Epidulcina cf. delphinae)]|nr:molecular chaperone TorD family protein [Candidatus Thiodiazotropha sp. (ex Epidulcina cf. delphinae)]